jgi:ATP-dependent exoDNAse (exonuclease V) beta subunit
LHRLRVGTLDSVFTQMARSFSLELGLPPGWQICDETVDRRLRVQAIREMLESQATDDTLRLMHLLSKGETRRSISRQILDLVNELYRIYLDSPAEAWRVLPRHKPLSPAELAAAMSELAEVALPDDKRFAKAHAKDLANAQEENWETFLSSGFPKQLAAGNTTYYKKEITPEMRAAYGPLIDHAKAQVLAAIAGQTEATHAMLARFEDAYDRIRLMQRALRFDDVTHRLGEAADARPLEQVAYRLDAHLAHLLLDEFQDTSPAQWHVLRPFARRIVNRPDDTFFCVGDVKQAIYGWRGGVAEILEAITGQLGSLTEQELDTSYRSSQPVIDFVNRTLGRLSGNAALEKYDEAARAWDKRFRPHSTARKELAGYCRVETGPAAGQGENQGAMTLDYAADRVAELHAAAPGRSIGVLVRRNTSVARLIYQLRKKHGIAASEEGGNPLNDSPAVELLLSLLRLADHPGDTAARFHVARSPLAEPLGLVRFDDNGSAGALSAEVRRRLLEDGYGRTIYEWTRLLAPHCDPRDLNRLVQLIEMAYDYEPRATGRADDFVDLVQQQRVEDPTSADVRVMTVHQSKGLQFDIVVLPELDYRFIGQTADMVVGRKGPTEPVERVCRYVKEDLRPLLPREYRAMFDKERQQTAEEALCLLYVALTRAVHALHLIVAPSKPNARNIPASPAGLVCSALGLGPQTEAEAVLHESGDGAWADTGGPSAPRAKPEAVEKPLRIEFAPASKQPRRGLDRRSPSQLEGGPRVDLASRIGLDTADALMRGTVIHAWFEQIRWLDKDGEPTDETLWRIARRHTGDDVGIRRWIDDFRTALGRSVIRDILSRSAYDGTIGQPGDPYRERPFAVREGNTIVSGTIDRLVVCSEGSTPVAADILDFKTDRVSADDSGAIARRVEFYRPQMQAYARAVASMFGLESDRVAARLVFVEAGVVQNLSGSG